MIVLSQYKGGEQEVFDINHMWIEDRVYSGGGTEEWRWFPYPHWKEIKTNEIYIVYYLCASLTGSGRTVEIGKFEYKETATDHMLKIAQVMATGRVDPYNNPYRIASTHC